MNFKNIDNRNLAAPAWGAKNRTREVALGDEVYSILRKLKATRIRPGKGKVSQLLFSSSSGGRLAFFILSDICFSCYVSKDLAAPKTLRYTYGTSNILRIVIMARKSKRNNPPLTCSYLNISQIDAKLRCGKRFKFKCSG